MTRSDESHDLAVRIAQGCFYPRIAEAIASSVRFCEMDGCPLTEEQTEQMLTAFAEAADGIKDSIHGVLDAQTSRGLLGGLRDA